MKSLIWVVITIISAVLILTAAFGKALGAESREELPLSTVYSGDSEACLNCHDEKRDRAVLYTPHWRVGDSRTPLADRGCESCHGPSGEHLKWSKKFRAGISFVSLGVDTAAEPNAVCLGCHQGGNQKHWHLSEHATAGITCASCHTIHAPRDRVLSNKQQAKVCTACHLQQRVNLLKYSRHPVREGLVTCTSCHNSHGGKGEGMLVQSTVNETCYQCHAEKRGPFLFEHEPVQDDCTHCHTPHGSVNDNLLSARLPFLCQQCHIASRHVGTGYVTGDVTGNTRIVGKSCTNCHGQVHGTNHPAGLTFRR